MLDHLQAKANRQRRGIQDTEAEIARIQHIPGAQKLVSTLRSKAKRQAQALELTELHLSTFQDPSQIDALEEKAAPEPKPRGRKD